MYILHIVIFIWKENVKKWGRYIKIDTENLYHVSSLYFDSVSDDSHFLIHECWHVEVEDWP